MIQSPSRTGRKRKKKPEGLAKQNGRPSSTAKGKKGEEKKLHRGKVEPMPGNEATISGSQIMAQKKKGEEKKGKSMEKGYDGRSLNLRLFVLAEEKGKREGEEARGKKGGKRLRR